MRTKDTFQSLRNEQLFIGTAIMNRLDMSNGKLTGYGNDGKSYAYKFGSSLSEVILKGGGEGKAWGSFANGRLSDEALDRLNSALDVDLGSAASAEEIADRSSECYTVMSAFWGAQQISNGVRLDPSGGGLALFWNSSSTVRTKASDRDLNGELVNLGRSDKDSGNVFFGLLKYPPVPRSRDADSSPRQPVGGGRSR